MLVDALSLAAGIALLFGGGEALVRGAAALARKLGVSSLVVGLTIVAFGTSAPELAVNVTAAVRGSGDVAFGNLIGSNLANIGLILASAALVRPLAIHSIVITRELPMLLLASAVAMVMGFDALRVTPQSSFDRGEGLVLLLLFGVFIYYNILETLRARAGDTFMQQVREREVGARLASLGASAALVVLGLAMLAGGSELTVSGAVGVAEFLGAPRALIGLTVVAVGTSLPELSATLLAARKGESDLAVGNVVGSNLFNLLFVLGVTATIRPVPVPPFGHLDLMVMMALATGLLVFALSRRRISRQEGSVLLAVYLVYIAWRAF